MMLIYLITSLPVLNHKIKNRITKDIFIKKINQGLPKKYLKEFNLLIGVEKYYLNNIKAIFSKKNKYKSLKNYILIQTYYRTKNFFLQEWVLFNIILNEIIVTLLLKKKNIEKKNASLYFYNNTLSISSYILRNYNILNLGLDKKKYFFHELKEIITLNNDLCVIEKKINHIKLNQLNKFKKNTVFHIDTLLHYYLTLSIIERENSFDLNKGKKKIKKILNSIII